MAYKIKKPRLTLIMASLLMAVSLVIMTSCTIKTPQSIPIEQYPPIFPPYQDSIVIPPNIAPLNFILPDSMENATVIIETPKTPEAQGAPDKQQAYQSNNIKISAKKWRKLCKPNTTIKITVHHNGKQYKPLHWLVSQDSIDPYIVYRLVLPTDGAYQTISLNERRLSNFKTRPIMQNTQHNGNCFNCHSFQNYNSSKYTLQLRNPRGLVINGRNITTPETKDEGLLYSSWHPQKDIIAFLQGGRIPIDFFMPTVGVVDTAANAATTHSLAAAGNAYFYNQVEINTSIVIYKLKTNEWQTITTDTSCEYSYPTWHPDGHRLYLTRSTKKPAPHQRPENPDFLTQYSFDLAYIDYNPETEQFGDSIQTLVKAADFGVTLAQKSAQGAGSRSYSSPASGLRGNRSIPNAPPAQSLPAPRPPQGSFAAPRISPDGKMLVATFSPYAGNPIRNNSILVSVNLHSQNPAVKPIATGQTKSNSWPSFSTNSKWLMFVSKQIDGYFTQVWFAHIDTETGKTTPAFPLPQATGNAYLQIPKAFNLPEFSTTPTEF